MKARWNVQSNPAPIWIIALSTVIASCGFLDDLVDVTAPDRISADSYESPGNLPTIVAGMIADFECALASYITTTGIAGDELSLTGMVAAPELLDKRQWETRGLGGAWSLSTCTFRNNSTPGMYRPLHTARWQADNLLRLLNQWTADQVPNRDLAIARAAAYAGYSLVLLGEVMCEVPLDGGPSVPSDQIFAEAADRFTTAIAAGGAAGAQASPFVNMAHVGLARARLNAGDVQGAAEAARQVPAGFAFFAEYSTTAPRRHNVLFADIQSPTRTLGHAFRTMEFSGVLDPRVPVFFTGQIIESGGFQLEVWDQAKYPSREAPIRIASHVEAQLIIAEAEYEAGNLESAVEIINEIHAAVGLPAFNSSDPSEIRDQLLYERRAEFFLEGHRFGDIRRYNLPLDPAPGTQYHKGGVYLDTRCFPVPGIESDANPNA
jgi:starch-binding outer membrane protein, SusD/RagB family